MFEITRNHEPLLEQYIYDRKAYKKGIYDFTFENRFLIYHTPSPPEYVYYALDMKTGLSSEVCRKQENLYSEENYENMIPQIFKAIKYTGDHRQYSGFGQDPMVFIDSFFRVMLPEYGYNIREEQIALCKDIYTALTSRQVGICEAEVGTGKTMAYLVAAFCAKNTMEIHYHHYDPVTIATSSIELQKNLMQKELPVLSRVLLDYGFIKRPLVAVLRKGKEHYFCPARHRDYVTSIGMYPEKYKDTLKFLLTNKFGTRAFDLDKIKMPAVLKDKLCVKGVCGGCRHETCHYRDYVKNALDGRIKLDFQVTNHNQYLMSTKLDGILRSSSLVIIDEGHKLKDAAQDIFGERLRETDIPKYIRWVRNMCQDRRDLGRYHLAMDEALKYNQTLFQCLRQQYQEQLEREEKPMLMLSDEMTENVMQLHHQLEIIDRLRKNRHGRQEISSRDFYAAMMNSVRPDKNTVWADDEDGEIVLKTCPKDTGATMAQKVWNRPVAHVLTSGTMSDGMDFQYFKQENGLDKIQNPLESTTQSPFDYANHTRLYIPKDMPFPAEEDPGYLPAIADRIVELVRITNGHTAVLFTSYKMLQAICTMTRDRLQDYPIIYMTKKNKTAIEDFKRSKNGVLFASGTMWEGVDCPGDILSSVIIVRLPFPQRTAAMEEKKEQYPDICSFVQQMAVPQMLIKLRQGAGRLIRNETDTGVLTILDSRANRSAYAGRIHHALGKYPEVDTLEDVETFLRSVKPAEFFEKGERNAD